MVCIVASNAVATLKPPVPTGGNTFNYIPALNDDPEWITALCNISERHLSGWDTQDEPNAAAMATSRIAALGMGAKQ